MKNVALITGASSGIGMELARIHAESGGDLVLVARRADLLDALKTEVETAHGVSVLTIAADLNDDAAPGHIFETVKATGIDVTYLVNNAGFGGRGNFHEQDWAIVRSMIQVDIVALTALTHLFLPEFVARDSGRILNVSSTAALFPGPLQAVYFASKAFVASLSNALVEELRDTKVTVTNLMPGATGTEFAQRSGMEKSPLFKKTASARDVARQGYDAMTRGDIDAFAGLRPGRLMQFRIARLLPKRVMLRLIRQTQETS